MDARQIVMSAHMSARPDYYSGRGATTTDLNPEILERIYLGIQGEYGQDAAQQFAQMVADMPALNATDFLNTLYQLENHGWRWDPSVVANGNGMDVGPDMGDGRRKGVAFATVVNKLFGHSEVDNTPEIRDEFLQRHGIDRRLHYR